MRPQSTFIRGVSRGEKNGVDLPVGVAVGLAHERVADQRDVDLRAMRYFFFFLASGVSRERT